MNATAYSEPVAQLLTLGSAQDQQAWADYRALGLRREHAPELVRMAGDDELNSADIESDEVWAPLHAWRALGQLEAVEVAADLLPILRRLDDTMDDWLIEEAPQVYSMMGPEAIPALERFLADATSTGLWARIAASLSLVEIAKQHPDARDEVVRVLSAQLAHFEEQHRTLNANLIHGLAAELQAVEAAEIIEAAYTADAVDLTVLGDWEDAQIHLGELSERQTPAPNYIELENPELVEQIREFRDNLDNPTQPAPPEKKPGRNDPCWCGSGKKYKHCHWRSDRVG